MLQEKQVKSAVNALFAFLAKRKESIPEEKLSLFDAEHDIALQIALKETPAKAKWRPTRIPLKHTIYGREGQEVCLITKDPQQEWEEKLEQTPVKNVTKVIGVTHLRKEYHQYKDKRELLSSYNLFLADERVGPLATNLLGSIFIKAKRQPCHVKLTGERLAKELAAARDSTYMFLTGPSLHIRIARTDFSPKEVVENIMTSIDAIVDKIPKKWKNVQNVLVRTHDSVALPIFSSLPRHNIKAEGEGEGEGQAAAAAMDESEGEEEEEKKAVSAKAAKGSAKGGKAAATVAVAMPKTAAAAGGAKAKKSSVKAATNTPSAPAPAPAPAPVAKASGKGKGKGTGTGTDKGNAKATATAAATAKGKGKGQKRQREAESAAPGKPAATPAAGSTKGRQAKRRKAE